MIDKEATPIDFSDLQQENENCYELDKQIYHALMPFKVREILIVSSLYDVFIIEEEGLISELVVGQYHHHLLTSPPRVTRVDSGKEALSKIKKNKYDLVITMSKNIGMDPFEFGKKIKEINPNLPVILLATDSADIDLLQQTDSEKSIDKVFFWTGDSALFLAIIKYVEDKINAPYDTVNGNVRVIIMLEDSIRYYSMFLPIIYTEIVQQTRRSLSEDLNEMQRLLRRRTRPKILLAQTFEEGIELFERYRDYVLGIIADINFKRNGRLDPEAGYKFVKHVQKKSKYARILMQSSDPSNRRKAEEIGAYFLDKNSPTLLEDFEHFLLKYLGFGDFIFLRPKKKTTKSKKPSKSTGGRYEETVETTRASNMKEFEEKIQKIPLESIRYHSDRNDFSNWLMARSEFKLAMKLQPKKAEDFTDLNEVRKHLINMFNESRREKQLGSITDFSQQKFEFDSSFTRLRGDSLGGKGRGMAFIRSLILRCRIDKKYPNIRIIVPNTVVIGTLEFDRFLSDNGLWEYVTKENLSDEEIAETFLKGKICEELRNDLKRLLKYFKKPIAVRSSSLLEDSQSRSFAGIYKTYMLPNNHKKDEVRLNQLCQAIKLIYASVFFKESRSYIKSTSSKIEEEKMAIVIQELVGTDYNNWFYPTFSGVAQSLNFYPVRHQKFEEGVASIAVGLGKTVVGGEKCIRFSIQYPQHIPEFSSLDLTLENAQRELYVVDMSKKTFNLSIKDDITLKKINIENIKNDSSLDLIVSTYDKNDMIIRDGLYENGFPLVTFAGLLKYNVFPFVSLLKDVLELGRRGMGCPVQIEFAVNLPKNNSEEPLTFAVLQIRPLVPSYEHSKIKFAESISEERIFIKSTKSMGNGIIESIKDIVYVHPDSFDPKKTLDIASEIEKINDDIPLPYLLIGPGRWGTTDRFLGIPVKWNQISCVKIMVETAFENFNIEPSQGTHFFHNITSRGIGYINVPYNSKENFIDWNWLFKQPHKKSLKIVRHVQLEKPLAIKLDGRKGNALLLKPKP